MYEGWQTLYFEIYLSLTAANTVTEWNHDLGGFMPHYNDGSPCSAGVRELTRESSLERESNALTTCSAYVPPSLPELCALATA